MGFQNESFPPHRADPIEDLNPGWYRNQHIEIEKAEVATTPHPRRKHMMAPNRKPNGDQGSGKNC